MKRFVVFAALSASALLYPVAASAQSFTIWFGNQCQPVYTRYGWIDDCGGNYYPNNGVRGSYRDWDGYDRYRYWERYKNSDDWYRDRHRDRDWNRNRDWDRDFGKRGEGRWKR